MSFVSNGSENESEKSEHGFKCTTCQKIFERRDSLTRHEKIHSGELNDVALTCTTCGQKFLYKSSLTRHQSRVHALKLAFACHLCDRRFRYESSLATHILIHRDSRPFKCTVCDKKCRTKYQLSQHLLVHDKTSLSWFCGKGCGKEFMTVEACNNHYRDHPDCMTMYDTTSAAIDNSPDSLRSASIAPSAKTHSSLVGTNLVIRSTI
jgi:KRAB domain-containing zinc finger protein